MTAKADAARQLRALFRKSGYVRTKDPNRAAQDGALYHKGYEVRLVVDSMKEAAQVRRWLGEVGFRAGAPFRKHNRVVVPVYGAEAVDWFAGRSRT